MEEKRIWADSVLGYVDAENIVQGENRVVVSLVNGKILLTFHSSKIYLMTRIEGEAYLLTGRGDAVLPDGCERGWILPPDGQEGTAAIEIRTAGGIMAECQGDETIVRIEDKECCLIRHASIPHADFWGNGYEFAFDGGEQLEQTLAEFYWGTLLPSVIERTRASHYPEWRGYVVSTLQPGEYAGTYPDVDHEFQCKGRIAMAGAFELDVVKRMMELQFRMMREDPIQMWRNPCSVQPDGTREYHIRRNSLDGSTNAEMFLVTGNVEVLETAWLYMAAAKDKKWLANHIENLEGAASLVEYLTDNQGRLWSDVYYEDQVMKDGMECMSASMAAHAYGKLAELEELLGRTEKAMHYRAMETLLADALVRPVPLGFWDTDKKQFVDWIDRNGEVHDHIHLLANSLPVLFSYTTKEQTSEVERLIGENLDEFQRFPTFLAARIEDYTPGEIGDGGPYDLCAAGRYWCWDAAYWAFKQDGMRLQKQLVQVAEQAKTDGYRMGERYDMNHVYYQSDKNWHGAPYYYEYPCVFSWVLIHDYLGIAHDIEADLQIRPRLTSYGKVRMDSYGVEYEYSESGFRLKNIAGETRSFRLSLDALKGELPDETVVVLLEAGEEISYPIL